MWGTSGPALSDGLKPSIIGRRPPLGTLFPAMSLKQTPWCSALAVIAILAVAGGKAATPTSAPPVFTLSPVQDSGQRSTIPEAQQHINEGAELLRQGQLGEALAGYNESIRLDPQFVGAYVGRGTTYQGLGMLENAVEDYDEAIRLNPELAIAYSNRGLTYHHPGQMEKAITDQHWAITIELERPVLYTNRYNAYSTIGEVELAV